MLPPTVKFPVVTFRDSPPTVRFLVVERAFTVVSTPLTVKFPLKIELPPNVDTPVVNKVFIKVLPPTVKFPVVTLSDSPPTVRFLVVERDFTVVSMPFTVRFPLKIELPPNVDKPVVDNVFRKVLPPTVTFPVVTFRDSPPTIMFLVV